MEAWLINLANDFKLMQWSRAGEQRDRMTPTANYYFFFFHPKIYIDQPKYRSDLTPGMLISVTKKLLIISAISLLSIGR